MSLRGACVLFLVVLQPYCLALALGVAGSVVLRNGGVTDSDLRLNDSLACLIVSAQVLCFIVAASWRRCSISDSRRYKE